MNQRFFSPQEGFEMATYEWIATNENQRLLIVHGMAEKGIRYERFALEANKMGISVFALDLPGHGKTSERNGLRGSFGPKGWIGVVEAIESYAQYIASEGAHLALFGHSMGSMLSLGIAERNKTGIKNFILSAFPPHPGALVHAGKIMGSFMGTLFGTEKASPFMNSLTFGKFNKGIDAPRTDFDWLSRDPSEVDAYIKNPDCGEVFTIGFFTELARMTDWVHKNKRELKRETHIHYIAGSNDPVVEKEAGTNRVIVDFKALNIQFSFKVYPGARHELLNDTCRDEVTSDLIKILMATKK
jgi:alpha-beta hydrolase superfamily lysophospholipase